MHSSQPLLFVLTTDVPPSPTPVRVINVKNDWAFDVYIGRANRTYNLPASIWANPHVIGPSCTRAEAIERYRLDLLKNTDLMAQLPSLRGKTLGCWCRPRAGFAGRLLCHGQILAGLVDGVLPQFAGN